MATALPYDPDLAFASSVKTSARVLRARYGDGYAQRTADGLNSVSRTWTWTWTGLTAAEVAALISVFETAAGADAISYDSRLWTVAEWSETPGGGRTSDVTATAVEEFDLV